jgi:hypothetical protein
MPFSPDSSLIVYTPGTLNFNEWQIKVLHYFPSLPWGRAGVRGSVLRGTVAFENQPPIEKISGSPLFL